MRIFMQTPPGRGEVPRYYQLILQEDLLGGWSLLRQWGRMGSRGALRKEHFDDRDAAQRALIAHRDQQLKRGFNVMFIHGGSRGG